MSYNKMYRVSPNWRDELTKHVVYKKRFAILPTKCSDDSMVWMKVYYKKYIIWNHHSSFVPEDVLDFMNKNEHTDFIENVTEEDYLVRKLAEAL